MLETHKALHGYQCYQPVSVQPCFDWGSVHGNLFFSKALCVTKALRLVTAPEKLHQWPGLQVLGLLLQALHRHNFLDLAMDVEEAIDSSVLHCSSFSADVSKVK